MSEIKNYYLNPRIKKIELQEEYTAEQIAEYVKCSEDPIYFIQNYVEINSLDKGFVKFILRGYQTELIESLHANNKNIILSSRQSGKCLCINSIISLRNKKTGEILVTTVGDFYEKAKNQELSSI